MTNTVQISLQANNQQLRDELVARLSSVGFYAFEESENELFAFIAEDIFDANSLEEILVGYELKYVRSLIPDQNWNALWESNFEPVVVDDFCAIRAHFHPAFKSTQHEIIITPKMSFGTGHHATTYMMISEMRRLNFKNREVADFGTGTGVLAILAEKLGSKFVWATDNDNWSIENATENIERNNCSNIKLETADGFFPTRQFDVILANINKSMLLKYADGLLFGLTTTGELLLSGLLKDDEAEIVDTFTQKGLKHCSTVEKNKWICISLEKVIR